MPIYVLYAVISNCLLIQLCIMVYFNKYYLVLLMDSVLQRNDKKRRTLINNTLLLDVNVYLCTVRGHFKLFVNPIMYNGVLLQILPSITNGFRSATE